MCAQADIAMDKQNISELLQAMPIGEPVVLKGCKPDCVKVVNLDGGYPYHQHIGAKETFIILSGELYMDREGHAPLFMKAGDIITIAKGLRHRTRTVTPCQVLLIGLE